VYLLNIKGVQRKNIQPRVLIRDILLLWGKTQVKIRHAPFSGVEMSILNNISLKAKLFAVVFFLVFVSVGISGTVYSYVKHIVEQTLVMRETSEQLMHAGRATANLLSYARAVEFLPLELTTEQRTEFERMSDDELRRLNVRLDQFRSFLDIEKVGLADIRQRLAVYQRDVHAAVVKQARANDLDTATKTAFIGAPMMAEMRALLRKIEEKNTESFKHQIQDLQNDQNELLTLILAIAIGGCILGLLAAFTTIILGITRPLLKVIRAMQDLASGKTDVEVEGLERADEIGDMVRTVATFRENATERKRLEEEAVEERQREVRRQAKIESLIQHFRSTIGGIRSTLDQEFATLRGVSVALSDIASQAAEGANSAQDASIDSSTNVQSVAKAAGELTMASREISEQVHRTSESVTRANEVARATDQDVSSLADLADRIGAIVDIISGIAEQTNMLALNATIEAARAGDAGRSFAVVAAEVKTLAGQTAKATDEISAQIRAIQSATQTAVLSIRTITGNVSEIEGRTTAIAAAVEEQEASTHEISKSIALASDGSQRVTDNVSSVSGAVEQTSKEAQRMQVSTDELMKVAGNLTRTVEEFLRNVTDDVQERRTATRHASRQAVVVEKSGRRLPTRLADVSSTGVKIVAVPSLKLGDEIEIEWVTGERSFATPVWIADGFCGLAFREPLSNTQLKAAA
jgi:methyl-accepting chemotaxis protein